MKKSQLIITLLMLVLLIGAGLVTRFFPVNFGAVPWYGWAGLAVLMFLMAVMYVVGDSTRERSEVVGAIASARKAMVEAAAEPSAKTAMNLNLLDPEGPTYPHPVINTSTCIGCHGCVDACP